jgi:Holliday junction resolvase RusA-like endonuclease
MNPIAHFTLPVRAPSKKNSQRIVMVGGHASLQPSKLYMAASEVAMKAIDYYRQLKGLETVTGPLQMKCTFRVAHKSGSKSSPDLTNLLHAPADWLQEAGIIENDRHIVSVDGSRVVYLCDGCKSRKSGCNYRFETRLKKNGEPWIRKGKPVRDKVLVCTKPEVVVELYKLETI